MSAAISKVLDLKRVVSSAIDAERAAEIVWSEGKQSEISPAGRRGERYSRKWSVGDSLSDGFEPFIAAPASGLPIRSERCGYSFSASSISAMKRIAQETFG